MLNLSILIVTKDRARALDECLQSINEQTKLPEEIVLVENNQKKTLQFLVSKYSQLPIKYVLERKIGIPVARNKALSIASGNLLGFIDDDCILDKNWVKRIEFHFEKMPQLVVAIGRTKNFYNKNLLANIEQEINDEWIEQFHPLNKQSEINSGVFIDTKNVVFKAKFLNKHSLLFNEQVPFKAEDTEFGIRLVKKLKSAEKVIYFPSILSFHKNNRNLISYFYKRYLEGKEKKFLDLKYQDIEPLVKRSPLIRKKKSLIFAILAFFTRQSQRIGYYF